MNKKIKISFTLLSIIIFYTLSFCFLRSYYGSIYSILIQPLFWLTLYLFTKYLINDNGSSTFMYKDYTKYIFFVAALSYVVINWVLGILISGFGNNFYDHSVRGIMMNLWMIGFPLLLMEQVRSSLVNGSDRSYQNKVVIATIATIVLIRINYIGLWADITQLEGLVKFIGYIFIPLLMENTLFTLAARKGGPIPSSMYIIIVSISIWAAPIVPDHEWIIWSLLGTLIPFFTLLVLDNKIRKKEKGVSARVLEEVNPKKWIVSFIALIITLSFLLGLTPIYPINIVSNSMNPKIKIGDVVIVRDGHIEDVKIGDIIEYQNDNHKVIHRVVQIEQNNDIIEMKTKGDNNDDIDDVVINKRNYIGKIIITIPKIGLPNVWFRNLLAN